MTQDSVQSVIFGFGHRARHGKDTVAAAIKTARGNRRPYDIQIYGFAGELKKEVNDYAERWGGMKELFNPSLKFKQTNGNVTSLPAWVAYDQDPDMTDPLCPLGKQRTLLQWWGTEFRRAVNENYWVERLAQRLAEEKPEIAFITDMRFPNEAAFVKKYGEIIKVYRPGLASPNSHISEEALAHLRDDEWGALIINNGSLENLKALAVQTFDRLMEERP